MNWAVRLVGNSFDVEEVELLFTSPQLYIKKIDNDYFIMSEKFNNINNAEEVFKLAKEYLNEIIASIYIFKGYKPRINVDLAMNLENPNLKQCYMFDEEIINITDRVRITLIDETGEHVKEDDIFKEIFELSLRDEKVQKVLKLVYKKGTKDWVNLYRIYEIIKSDIDPVKQGWAESKVINNFKHTANHPAAAGDGARHGFMKSQAPRNPMNIVDAKQLIETIVKKWIIYKVNDK